MTTSNLAAAVMVAVVASACAFEPSPLSPAAHVTCSSNEECPLGTTCRTQVGRCLPEGSEDVPPAVVAGSVVISPSYVRAGARVVVTFELDEALLDAPEVRIGDRAFTFDERDGQRWTFSYRATGTEEEGVAPVLVTASDLYGNVARDLALGTTTFDFTPPAFADVAIDGASVVGEGGSIVVQVSVAEELPQPPVVTLEGRALEVISSAAGQHRFEYVARGDEPEGTASFHVAMSDHAGNEAQRTVEELVSFDFTAPVPVADSFRLLANPVRAGAPASLAFIASEPPSGLPEVFVRDGSREVIWRNVNVLGVDVTASHVVEGLASGAHEIRVRGLRDAAGNDAGEQVLGVLDVDTQAPVIAALTTSHRHARSGDRLVVTFEVDEALASEPEVMLGEQRAVLDASEGGSFQFAFQVDEGTYPEGVATIVVLVTDRAGNVASAMTTVQLDYTPPSLTSSGAQPSRAPAGSELVVSMTPSEPLGEAPTLSVEGPSSLSFAPVPDSAYAWRHAVTSADADGPYTATVTMSDLAGNTSTVTLPAFELDVQAPVVSALAANRSTFSRADGFDAVVVTFDASESFEDDGGLLVVSIGGRAMACDPYSEASPNYTCRHTVDVDDREGANIVLVAARDGAGNSTTASTSVVFDFTAPAVSSASVVYVADLASPLGNVDQATVGTRIVITAVANEALAPTPTLTLSAGEALLADELQASRVDPGSATFELVVPAGTADAWWTPTITWRDEQGNESTTATFASPRVRTVTSRPTLVVDQDAVTFLRSRWGNSAEESFGPWTLPAGSVFALAPADPLSPETLLPPTTFAFSMGRPIRRVRVWADAGKETLLGTVAPDGSGAWPRTTLARVDTPSLWVTGLDAAGNESQVVAIANTEWVATANPTATGASPHRLEATGVVESTLAQSRGSVVGSTAGRGLDGTAQVARTEVAWRSLQPQSVLAPQRGGFLTGYDPVRGRLVSVGGQDAFGDVIFDDVWEWDGLEWRQIRPDRHPPQRDRAVMAYDAARGRLVLFGGRSYDQATNTTVVRNDLWEWDGAEWTELTPAGDLPVARYDASMAYDAGRARLVLFGGDRGTGSNPSLGDTWAFDGHAWTRLATAAQGPGTGSRLPMAYDSVRKRMVLVHGFDTWELAGNAWSKVTGAGQPSATSGATMAFDPVSERVLLFGGSGFYGALNETWAFDGTAWQQLETSGRPPTARFNASLVFDAGARRLLMLGGETHSGLSLSLASEVWSWEGERWENQSPSASPAPAWLSGAAVAYDEARGRVVVFGSTSREDSLKGTQDLWEWSLAGWKQIPVSSPWPGARHFAALAYDPQRQRVVMFGGMRGYNDYYSDTWEWDGEVWTPHDTTASMAPRMGHSMTWHAGLGRVVMVGGFARDRPYGDPGLQPGPWIWDGTSWTNGTPATTSFTSAPHALIAHDPGRDRLVLYSEVTGSTHRTWEWDGTSWTSFHPSVRPGNRTDASLFFDPDRGRTVLYGGEVFGSKAYSDLWEWDGAAWVKLEQSGTLLEQVDATLTVGPGGRKLLVGGWTYNQATRSVLWQWLNATTATPAFQLTTSALDAGFTASQVTGLRVRAHCGARYSPYGTSDVGATLWGWTTQSGGGWEALGSNSTGVTAASPWIVAPPQAAIEWAASSPEEASRFILERDRLLAFQCRPSGASGRGAASVALDYLEVRVRYRTP